MKCFNQQAQKAVLPADFCRLGFSARIFILYSAYSCSAVKRHNQTREPLYYLKKAVQDK